MTVQGKDAKMTRLKEGDHVRSMDGIKEGYISSTNGTHADVVWIDGTVSDKPILHGFLEKIKPGLTSFAKGI